MTEVEIKSDDVVTIAGQRGFGKTTLGGMIALQFKSVIIYDPMFNFGKLKGFVKTTSVEGIGNLQKVVFQPVDNTEKIFEKFCKYIWYNRKNVMVIIDEADEHAKGLHLPASFGKLVRLGRHKGIGVAGITRRIADYHKTPVALSHHVISFKQTLTNDIEYLEEFIGKENAQRLRTLEYFQYLWKNFNNDQTYIGTTKKIL